MDHYYRIAENPDNIQWEKLDDITISHGNTKFFGYNFYYNSSTTQRLTLESVKETDSTTLIGKIYAFDYDDIAGLPDYGGNWTDHWGYYNGVDINNTSRDIYYNNKNTSSTLVTKGLIKKISYPTGGYTTFDWEANTCSKTVALNRQSLSSFNDNYGYVGGCRIKRISNYSSAGATPITKDYYYVSNYSNSTYSQSSSSSGILNGVPNYNFSVTNRPCDIINDNCYITFSFFSTNGYATHIGSHIGYNEVVEKNGDGSYSKYLFSNYGLDSNGKLHFDTISTYIGWKAGEDTYIPFSSRENERGKMLGVYKFKNSDIPVEKTFFRYRDDGARFGDYIRRMDYRNSIGCSDANSIIFASTHRDFKYNYYLVQKETDQYNSDGNITLTDFTNYRYNSFNQVVSEIITNSDNSDLATSFKYPSDFSDFEALPEIAQLKQKFIINPHIEKVVRKNNKVVNAEYSEYGTFFTNLIKPQKIYQLNSNTPIVDNDFYFKRYIVDEDDENLWVEQGGDNTQSVTINVAARSQVDLSLRLSFPSTVCGYYTVSLDGALKVYTGLSDNSVLEINERLGLSIGNHTIILSYITYPGHELCAMLGIADITVKTINGDIEYNSNLIRQTATLNYNTAGQINEVQKTDDLKSSYFWGYKNIYPIVKSENVSNSDLTSAVNSASSNDIEGLLTTVGDMTTDAQKAAWKTFNSSLRSALPANTMISTYTYAPLIGVTSSTGPDGVTMYYEYDTFGRLQYIRDDDGRILKSFEYHYKP